MSNNLLRELEGRVPSLDGVRAVSISMVVTSHALMTCSGHNATWLPTWALWLFNGNLGVHIFFVISGFIITLLLLKEEQQAGVISLGEFYKRRAIRILPPYLAVILAVLIIDVLAGLEIGRKDFIAAVTFTTGWWKQTTWLLAHSWSLSVEEEFYLLWPLILILVRGKIARYWLLIAILVIFPLMRIVVYRSELVDQRAYLIITQGDSLLCGFGLAMLLFHEGELLKRWLTTNVVVTRLICVSLIFFVTGMESNAVAGIFTVPFANTIYSIVIAWLLGTIIVNRGIAYRILNSKPFVFVGIVSYSWYLWQQLFLVPCGRYERWVSVAFPLSVLASFAAAVASYYLIERPSKKLRDA